MRCLLDVLMGRADSIVVEPVDPLSDHAEFLLRRGAVEEAHQAKRQLAGARNWTLRRLAEEGVLDGAKALTDSGRRYIFVSTIPAEPLGELGELAGRAADFEAFATLLGGVNQEAQNGFAKLGERWGSPQAAWAALSLVDALKPDEQLLHQTNLAVADMVFDGDPDAAVALLADIAEELTGVPLTADRLWTELEQRHVRRNPRWDAETTADLVRQQTDRYLKDAGDRMFQPAIERAATRDVVAAIDAGERMVMVAGAAGGGKSAATAAAASELIARGDAVLAFRLDAYMDVRTSRQLGEALDLPSSPAVALARASGGRRAVLVVDQLDAVSLASGRSPEVFSVVQELLSEAARLGVQVVLACRKFDIDNDARLRALTEKAPLAGRRVIDVALLTADEVETALAAAGVEIASLEPAQRDLLRLPLNLALLAAVPPSDDSLKFATTRDLLAQYWKAKRRATLDRRPGVRFDRVMDVLVEAMSTRQTLAVPALVLEAEGLDDDFDVLASENVVVHTERARVAFFHESLFDYAFARRWVATGQTVLEFLLSDEQELFRRAQVRQVLLYLREYDDQRFVDEVRAVLGDARVRYHVQDSVFFILRGIEHPARGELDLMLELLAPGSRWLARAAQAIQTPGWFAALDAAGVIDAWLDSEDRVLEERTIMTIGADVPSHGERIASLLAKHTSHPDYFHWLRWVIRRSDGKPDRALFDLLLAAVREGLFNDQADELFMLTYRLGGAHPQWGAELLGAWFAERPGALELQSGQVIALKASDHGLLELISKTAEGSPETFARTLLPFMQQVMAIAEQGDHVPRNDWHFSSQLWSSHLHDADDALMHYMARALRAVASVDPDAARDIVEPLVDDIHSAAQELLYEAVAGAGFALADWAADLLLRSEHALEAGYSGSYYWRTRDLLLATAEHMTEERFAAVEERLLEFVPDWEKTHPPSRGHASFVLLTGLPEQRLSETGRRRLGELRRKFERDQPEPPTGVRGGFVGPPIPDAQANRMTDAQWLSAMKKYATNEGGRDEWFDLRGGAYELSHVLERATKDEPARFAQLGLKLDSSFNDNYLSSILRGLGQTEDAIDPELVFTLMRHAASVGGHDRWLANPLARLDDAHVPTDIIEMILARALGRTHLNDPKSVEDPVPDMQDTYTNGLNTTRGGNVWALTRLVAFDVDGSRTKIVAPYLDQLAQEPSADVRSLTAELIRYATRWEPEATLSAFSTLVRDRAPALMTEDRFSGLIFTVTVMNPELVIPITDDLLGEADPALREHGARFRALVAIEGGHPELLPGLDDNDDPAVRRGAALILAARARWTETPDLLDRLARRFDDADQGVREAAATVVANLRGQPLERYRSLLSAYIASRSDTDLTQLLITLEHSPEPEHELVIQAARKILETQRDALGDIRTGVAGDARYLTQLLLRSYSAADDIGLRGRILDVIDELLAADAYGIASAIDEMAR